MKVLWFTNNPLPVMQSVTSASHAGTGSWIVALLEYIQKQSDIRLAVACVSPGMESRTIESDGVTYFCISQGELKRLFHFSDPDNNPSFINECARVIKEWQPDLIHIHGTERFYGLLSSHPEINIPIVISIQGLITECSKWRYTFGDLSIREIALMHDLSRAIRGFGPLWDYRRLLRNARREEVIIRSNRYFMGRTDWDHAHVKAINPSAHYYHVEELLRPEFMKVQWDVNHCRRHSIIFTNARQARRDIDSLFHAVALLKQRFNDVSLRLAGVDGLTGEYGLHLARLAKKIGIRERVEFLGNLNAKKMSHAMALSHVFALPSLIENSPNSLCEAQTVGLPCVATYTGGVPSLISEGETGFMVPVGDACMLAERISKIFENDELAKEMGKAARQKAQIRHDPDMVTESLLKVYTEVSSCEKQI